MLFGSANRDRPPSTAPTTLDLARDPNPYLSFGAGIHYCLGAPLAKLELGIAFETLLRRAPRLELVEAPRWKPTFVLRGLAVAPRPRLSAGALRRARRLVHDRDVGRARADRWPNQLVARARRERAGGSSSSAISAVNGYTSDDLIRDELPALDGLRPRSSPC